MRMLLPAAADRPSKPNASGLTRGGMPAVILRSSLCALFRAKSGQTPPLCVLKSAGLKCNCLKCQEHLCKEVLSIKTHVWETYVFYLFLGACLTDDGQSASIGVCFLQAEPVHSCLITSHNIRGDSI